MDNNKLTEFLKKVEAQSSTFINVSPQSAVEDDEFEMHEEQLSEDEIQARIDTAIWFKERCDNSKYSIKFFNVIDKKIELHDDSLSLNCVPEFFGICNYLNLLHLFGFSPIDVTSCKLFIRGRTKMFHNYYVYSLSSSEKLIDDKQYQSDFQYEIDLKGLYDKFGSADFRLETDDSLDSLAIGNTSLQINGEMFDISNIIEITERDKEIQASLARIDTALKFKENYDNSRYFIKFFNVIDKKIELHDDFLSLNCVPEFFVICDYEKFLQFFGYKLSEVTSCKLSIWGRTKMYHSYYIYDLHSSKKLIRDKQFRSNYQYKIDLKELYDKYGSADFRLETDDSLDSLVVGDTTLQINGKMYNVGQFFKKTVSEFGIVNNEIKNIEQFPIADLGEGYFNINDGNFIASFTSFKADDFAIPLNITHYHNPGKGIDGYGSNWRLSLNTYLNDDLDNKSLHYLKFLDETGEAHTFKEEFYYIENGAKIFIPKSFVNIDISGNLTYDGKEVKIQQFCDGYILIPEIKDYGSSEYIDQRQSEQAELEDYIKSCEQSLCNYVKVQKDDGLILRRIGNLTKTEYDVLMEGVTPSSNYCIMNESEALQLQSLYENSNQLRKQLEQIDFQKSQIDLQESQISFQNQQLAHQINQSAQQQSDLEYEKIYHEKVPGNDSYTLKKILSQSAEGYWDSVNLVDKNGQPLNDDEKKKKLIEAKELVPYKSAVHNLDLAKTSDTLMNKQKELLNKQLNSLFSQRSLLSSQKDSVQNQLNFIETQITYLISQSEKTLPAIQESFTKYFAKKAELQLMLLQAPVNYLKNENGLVSGFNRNGNLCCMFDSYGNSVAIEYDNLSRIIALHDSKGKIMRFRYVNGLLESITDSRGRCINYGYTDGNLTSVKFADGKTAQFEYSDTQLVTITSSENIKCNLEYLTVTEDDKEIKKFKGLTNFSQNVTIQKNFETNKDLPYDKILSSVIADYDVKKVNLTDNYNTFKSYLFYSADSLRIYKHTDEMGHETETEYIYDFDPIKAVTQWTRSPLKDIEYLRTEYSDSDKEIFKTTNWQKISPTCERKTQTDYSYDADDRLSSEIVTEYICLNGEISATETITNYRYNAQGSLILTEKFVKGEELTSGITYEERTYDENGNVIKSVSWNSLDSSARFYTQSDRSENGQITADRNEEGEISTEYEYVNDTNIVNSVRYSNGSKMSYGRNPYNFNVTSITQSTDEGEANTTDIIYEHSLPVEVKSGNTVIEYAYDYKGRKTAVKVNGALQTSCTYTDFTGNPTNSEYTFEKTDGTSFVGENEIVTSCSEKSGIRDESSNIIKVSEKLRINDSDVLVKNYDEHNRLTDLSDYVAQTYTEYTYDDFDNISKVETANNGNIVFAEDYTYNEYGKIASKNIATDSLNQVYSYIYRNNMAQNLDEITFGGSLKFKPLSDVNGRNTGKEITNENNKIAGEYISYKKVGDHATNMPSCIWFGSGSAVKDSIKYKYDNCGNICEIKENGHIVAKYSYDSLNRIIREDNKQLGKTVLFNYDPNGNITERCEYAYTAKTGEELSELECTHYSYDYIGDKLVAYSNEGFAYNNLGSPTTYRNKVLQWQYGKRLINFDGTTFTYDGQGKRISKGAINFVYDADGNLIFQSNGLQFIYDDKGAVGVIQNGNMYFYRKDIQGNIIAILDGNGEVVVKYVYDAWGNHAVLDAKGNDIEDANHIGNINPFRYRGYYYDVETGLYYLQTRYYDPETGRFISQDNIEYADPETINGLNLYAYCRNNPVMMTDETGTMPNWLKWLLGILIIVTSIAISFATAGLATPIASSLGGGLFGAIIGGAVAGAIGGAVAGFGISLGLQGISQGFNNINWKQVGVDTLSGAISGAIAGGLFGGLKYVASASKVASKMSGLKNAQENFNKASFVLQNTPIKITGGVMATERVTAQLAYNVASTLLGSAQSVARVIEFTITQFYRLAQFGLKLFVNYNIKG
ncbi:MAG: hypothetical protein HDQ88_00425 [Clostridia bacterium]|nr:hypothetical protein [Clostridia bacterium]